MEQHTHPRLYFLDWLRILAFALLVPYHVGMYYVTWDWHVKSPAASHAVEPLMMLTAPWRLSLLFFIGGAACQTMLARKSQGKSQGFLRRRSKQLLWPLLFGMLVVVPPQAWFQAMEQYAYSGSYADFIRLYLSGYHGFCHGTECLSLPTWNHLWFLPYLWVYSVLAWAILRLAPALPDRIAAGRLTGPLLLIVPTLPLMAARLLVGLFPSTHNLSWDWYNHAQYLAIFMTGLLFMHSPALWDRLAKMRWPALLLALTATVLITGYFAAYQNEDPPAALRFAQRLLFGALQWWAIAAACGFARQHLDSDSLARRWLTPSIFCVYILHQTVIIGLTRLLLPLQLPPVAEGLLLIATTFAICGAGYVLARRVPVLRGALGIAPLGRRDYPEHPRRVILESRP